MINGDDILVKILSVDPKNYVDAPSEAIRRVLEIHYKTSIPRGSELDLKHVGKSHQLRNIPG